jgi:hypothetical protein
MSAHEMAARIVKTMPELQRDGHLNQMLTIEAWLLEWQRSIVENTTAAALQAMRGVPQMEESKS